MLNASSCLATGFMQNPVECNEQRVIQLSLCVMQTYPTGSFYRERTTYHSETAK
jgi:hypothetical protein